MSERSIQSGIIKALRGRGGYVVNQTAAEAGVPDLLVCYEGRFYGLEVKQPKRYPTPLQRHHLELIEQSGGISAVVRSVSDALEVLDA